MDKDELTHKVLTPANVDYIYSIAFFVLFIFSLLLVVRPLVMTVFTLNQELADLTQANTQYAEVIRGINKLQAVLVSRQADFPLLDQALPDRIRAYQVMRDLQDLQLAGDKSITITVPEINIGQDRLKANVSEKSGPYRPYSMTLTVTGSYDQVRQVLDQLHAQRRLKTIKSLQIQPNIDEGGNITAKIDFEFFSL